MSLSYVDDFIDKPVGLLVMAISHEELVLIVVMSGWVATFAPRKYPEGFLKHPTLAYPTEVHCIDKGDCGPVVMDSGTQLLPVAFAGYRYEVWVLGCLGFEFTDAFTCVMHFSSSNAWSSKFRGA